jgi:hypothetical protein
MATAIIITEREFTAIAMSTAIIIITRRRAAFAAR